MDFRATPEQKKFKIVQFGSSSPSETKTSSLQSSSAGGSSGRDRSFHLSDDQPDPISDATARKNTIVTDSELLKLFKRCQECGAPIVKEYLTLRNSRTCKFVFWECTNMHKGTWKGQGQFPVAGSGQTMSHVNLDLAVGIPCTGNSFQIVDKLFEFMDLANVSVDHFHKLYVWF